MNVNSPIFIPMGHVMPPPTPPQVPGMYMMYDGPPRPIVPAPSVLQNSFNQFAPNQPGMYAPAYPSQLQAFQHGSGYIYPHHQGQMHFGGGGAGSGNGLVMTPPQNSVPYQYVRPHHFYNSSKRPLITKEDVERMLLLQRRVPQTNIVATPQKPAADDEEQSDTLQHDGSKGSQFTQEKDDRDTKNDSRVDLSLTVKCQKQKSTRNGQKQKHNHKSHNSDSYQKKAQASNKEFDALLTNKLNGIRDMDFTSNGEYFASGTEESITKHHNPKHRNSSASDIASTSDDVNSISSREDLSDTYDLVKVSKKNARARRNRKLRRQQQQQQQEQPQQQQNQPQSAQQEKKQSRSSSKSSSGTASPTPSLASGAQAGQQKQNKAIRKNGKDTITAIPQKQSTLKTAKEYRMKSHSANASSSTSSSPSTSAANSVSSSPTASPKAKRIGKIRHMIESPLGLVDILSEYEIASYLSQYIPDAKKLRNFGYPVESSTYEGCIEIYKSFPRFYPPRVSHTARSHHIGVVNPTDGLKSFSPSNRKLSSGDSGKGSGTSTPLSYNASPADSDYSEEENVTDIVYSQIVEKNCVRCKRPFKVSTNGEYITREPCNYHWGKQEAGEYMDEKGDSTSITFFSCCKKVPPEPCTQNHVHVWTDITSGLNGPYTDFVHTEPKRRQKQAGADTNVRIYALDCEMSYTGFGMEVTKVTVIAYNGSLVYESIVHPRSEVGDYNTRFSGVSEKDFEPGSDARTLETVQNDLLELIDADDILIGHALENDLRSLRIVHKRIVDTAIIFPHPNGFPYRRGLKSIVAAELGREIQVDEAGHSSLEDSLACLELMLLKVCDEFQAKCTKKAKSDKLPKIPKSEQFIVVAPLGVV